MIKTISENEFIEDLLSDEYASWTYDGARALYEYLTDLEEDTGEQIEFDRVALRCDFSQYDNLEDILNQYNDINTLEDLQDNTTVLKVTAITKWKNAVGETLTETTGYIIQNF